MLRGDICRRPGAFFGENAQPFRAPFDSGALIFLLHVERQQEITLRRVNGLDFPLRRRRQ